MIWEEEGHHIFINHENKYNYTFSSSWALHETLIWFCLLLFSKELSLQALQHKEIASRAKVWAKRAPNPLA